MDRNDLEGLYTQLEPIVGKDISKLLKQGTGTKTLYMNIVKEDFTINEIVSKLSELNVIFKQTEDHSEESEFFDDMKKENYTIQAKHLDNVMEVFRSLKENGESYIKELPNLLDQLIEKQITTVYNSYFNKHKADHINLRNLMDNSQIEKEKKAEFMIGYFRTYFKGILDKKISSDYFKKGKFGVLENFHEKYLEILETTEPSV